MSRGNFFVSPNTQHYFYFPNLYKHGLAFLDATGFNILKNPNNPIARQAKEITDRSDVRIYGYSGYIDQWMKQVLGIDRFTWTYINAAGDEVTDDSLVYSPVLTNIGGLINYVQFTDYATQQEDLRDGYYMATTIQSIQNSIYGYALSNESTFGDGFPFKVRAFFPYPYANRNDRTIATKGTNLIQDVPRLASGKKFHYQGSRGEELGTYIGDNSLSVEDASATVSGPLKTKWNNNLGVFESSQTFLAVLLTDVDGANIQKIDFSLGNIEGATKGDFYGKDAPHKMFEFTTGIAMPLGLESMQPQSFGPNIIKCAGETKAETIRVINRGRTNYDSGEIVIIHQIDGENIIGGKFSETTVEQRPPEPGRWNFTKFFANSDEYFRISVPGLDKSQDRPNVSPDELVDILYQRYYFYDSSDPDLSNNKLDDDATFIPSWYIGVAKLFEYYQSHISDIAPYIDNRINIYVDPDGGTNVGADMVDQRDVTLFFGPMFPDGTISKVDDYDKFQTPGEYVYPFMYDAHEAIRTINRGNYHFGAEDKYTASGIVPVADLTRVQFSLCSCELLGAGDQASLQLPKTIADIGRFGSANTAPRRFPAIIQLMTGAADYPGQTLLQGAAGKLTRPAVQRRGGNGLNDGKIAQKFGNGAMAAMYRGFAVPAGFEDIIPYDAYIDYVPLNSPKNAPALFGGDTGPESTITNVFQGGTPTQYVGSNAVGITSARLRMNQGSGGSWTLGAEVDQTFGMKGRFFGGGGGGGITTTIIGAIMAFSSDNRGRTIQGSVPMWGSNKGDSIDSFGTAACHIQVWDAWPDEDTTWIPQYMCALHFNPSLDRTKDPNQDTVVTVKNYAYASKKSNGDWAVKPQDYDIKIKKPSLVSYGVPTYGDEVTITYTNLKGDLVEQKYTSYGTGNDGQSVPSGPLSGKLRPQNLWNTATHREGKLVTKHGYHWKKSVIGLHNAGATVKDKEDGFKEGKDNIYTVGRGDKEARFYISGDNIVFDEIEWFNNSNEKKKEKVRGEGYLPSDLPVTTTIRDSNGKSAQVTFNQLYVYGKHYHDVGPRARSALKRVTMSSGAGQERMWGPSSSSILVEGNKTGAATDLTLYSGQYEIFVYVHNDVGFAWHNPPEDTTGFAMAQFITLKLV